MLGDAWQLPKISYMYSNFIGTDLKNDIELLNGIMLQFTHISYLGYNTVFCLISEPVSITRITEKQLLNSEKGAHISFHVLFSSIHTKYI